jgi:hypothetical protein
MATALDIVRRYFPDVKTVKDAEEEAHIQVTTRDNQHAKVKNHTSCAMAVACKRAYQADGVIISISVAYIIKNGVAIRFRLPESIAREVVSFDRKGGFAPGEYKMLAPDQKHTVNGKRHGPPHDPTEERDVDLPKNPLKKHRFVHFTEGIRTVLGSKKDIA